MVVGPSGQCDRAGVDGLQAVPLGESMNVWPVYRGGQPACELVRLTGAGAVAAFPDREEKHHALDVRGGQRRAHSVEGMGKRVDEAPLAKKGDELVHRRPVRL